MGLPDPSGRRGLWMRLTPAPAEGYIPKNVSPIKHLELCAGREGDDDYVHLQPGEVLTEHKLRKIEGLIQSVRFAFEQGEDECEELNCRELVHKGRTMCTEHYWESND